jgi:ribosome recycling factor
MPRRNEQNYMLVKTHDGYIKIDRDGNKFPVNPQAWTPQREKEMTKRAYVNFEKGHIETLLALIEDIATDYRELSKSEKFVEELLKEALDRVDFEW